MLLVDAANVVGSRPDGWWRDRAAAADRLIARVAAAVETGLIEEPVTVVLEGRARGANAPDGAATGTPGELNIDRARASGDDRIVEVASEAVVAGEQVTVVTADRGLIDRLRPLGAQVEGPGKFLRLLEQLRPESL